MVGQTRQRYDGTRILPYARQNGNTGAPYFALAALTVFYRGATEKQHPVQDDAHWPERYQQLGASIATVLKLVRELVAIVLGRKDHWEVQTRRKCPVWVEQ